MHGEYEGAQSLKNLQRTMTYEQSTVEFTRLQADAVVHQLHEADDLPTVSRAMALPELQDDAASGAAEMNNLGCVEHKIPLEEDGTCKECARLAAARVLTERALQNIEKLTDKQQQHVLECGMRMRELACFYGPYFRYALTLTSCEIASGALIMPLKGECDNAQQIMLPGNKTADQLVELALPPGVKRH